MPFRRAVRLNESSQALSRHIGTEECRRNVLIRIAVNDGPVEIPNEEYVDGGESEFDGGIIMDINNFCVS